MASDMWALEQLPGSSFAERSGDSVDFYHRWKQDIDLIKSLALNSFRFGIEWARVEPTRGHFSAAELAHYRRIIDFGSRLTARTAVMDLSDRTSTAHLI